jgi:hypothetical protein
MMSSQVKPTKKNSPAIHHGANRDNEPASKYAAPHTSGGKALEEKDIGFSVEMPTRKNWTPLNGGVSIGVWSDEEKDGVVMRGYGAATKGIKSRGPLA